MVTDSRKTLGLSKIIFYATIAVYLLLALLKFPGNIICWDVFGYYLYLPFSFIFDDIELKNEQRVWDIINTYHNTATFYQGVKLENGVYIMKYSMGLAILYAPFFFIGHIMAVFTSYPADGFSLPYQISLFVGCLFYTIVGLYFLRKILLHFFDEKTTAITFLLIIFGTNYFAHTAIHGQGAMPHNLLFSLYAALIYFTIKFHEKYSYLYAAICGSLIGLMALSRPTEVIAVIIPMLWGITNISGAKEKLSVVFKNLPKFLLLFFCVGAIGFLQFIYWKIHVGKFVFNSYGANPGEGFEFTTPYFMEVLFSFRKGWFIYTPIMLLMFLVFPFTKTNTFFVAIITYFVINLYIISSWSCWWYADSFGQRALVPSYAFMALALGAVIAKILSLKNQIIKIGFLSICALFVFLNLFQTWQLDRGIMDTQRMTRAYYQSTFLQTKPVSEEQKKLLLIQRNADGKESLSEEELKQLNKNNTAELKFDEKKDDFYTDTLKSSGKYAILTFEKNQFTPHLDIAYKTLTAKHYAWIKVMARIYIPSKDTNKTNAALVVSFRHHEYDYKYKGFNLNNAKLTYDAWQEISFYYLTPEVRNVNDNLRFYIWNPSQTKIFVDYLKIESYEPKADESFF
ncbi:MAG TPA: hypothetical protein VK835_14245 [Bacteroidia bacterium]|jgi:hypothetical protein|nr:hypothetical protein [Bacteroidia bacterium]